MTLDQTLIFKTLVSDFCGLDLRVSAPLGLSPPISTCEGEIAPQAPISPSNWSQVT